MKLSEIKIISHSGDHPSLFNSQHPRPNNEPSYFPHIHFGSDECAHPRFYKSTSHYSNELGLCRSSRNSMAINEAGNYQPVRATFDAFAELLAAAPKLLYYLHSLGPEGAGLFAWEQAEMHALVTRLMSYEIEKRDGAWGPYFNEDGTPYKEDE